MYLLSFPHEHDACASKLSKVKGLKIGHLNVRSLHGMIDEIHFLIFKINLDILCLTETWLHDMIDDSVVKNDGYHLIRRDRNYNTRGGGVCIYVRNTIVFSRKKYNLLSISVEATWI